MDVPTQKFTVVSQLPRVNGSVECRRGRAIEVAADTFATGRATTDSVNTFESDWALPSVTPIVNDASPAVVGVPETSPVDVASSDSPAGNAPAVTDQVYGSDHHRQPKKSVNTPSPPHRSSTPPSSSSPPTAWGRW